MREGRGSWRWGWAGWPDPCLTTPAPPPAATVGSSQPTILSAGNNRELSGAVSSAASPRGDEGSVSLSWTLGQLPAQCGRAQQLGYPRSWLLPRVPLPLPVSLPGPSPQEVPSTGLLFAKNERGGRQGRGRADSTRVSGHVCFGLCHYGRDGQLSLTISSPSS